jgi:dihydroorotate dehydrogenase electron transfer subunit
VDILYKVFGRGSYLLSKVKAGEFIDILGPLGNGFKTPAPDQHLILVGGGVGIPPIYFLAKCSLKNGFDKNKITFLVGFTNGKEAVLAERVAKLGVSLHYATDDGSRGYKGFVSELLRDKLREGLIKTNPLICACGPDGMLKAIKQVAKEFKTDCFLSLESIMPCGVGTCLGCVVKKEGEDRFFRVCRDGPVLNAAEVEL